MSYEDTLRELSEGTERVVSQLWAAVERGELDRETFDELAARFIAHANARADELGRLSIRAYLEAVTGTPEPAPALPPAPDDADRLGRALNTIHASRLDTPMQLARLARAEPLHAATAGAGDTMRRSRRVKGWTRGLEADACELCRWWWRNGRVWRPDHAMPRHTGCLCHQVPTTTTTSNFQTERQRVNAVRTNAQRHRKGTAA